MCVCCKLIYLQKYTVDIRKRFLYNLFVKNEIKDKIIIINTSRMIVKNNLRVFKQTRVKVHDRVESILW